ncbi:hypothetical protein [Georgenia sp. AZ-5]|uniref:hypothetical protein n=1 Tax=Georgenia sp. AZ-5 TaxID=3367526 RepID=UPI0037547291
MTEWSFTSSAGLRELLIRLHRDPQRWRDDREAAALVAYCADRYRALARKYEQEPADAARAAFEVLLAPATRWANDPWGVVTSAVRHTLQREHRAHGLLCGDEQARHLLRSRDRDVTRFADHRLLEFHPALQIRLQLDAHGAGSDDRDERWRAQAVLGPDAAVQVAVEIFVRCGWQADHARQVLAAVCARTIEAGSRATAFEYLRRDVEAWAHLDLTQHQWTRVLTVVLGSQHRDEANTDVGRGVLWRLIAGHTREEVLADERITRLLEGAAPRALEASHV